MLMLKRASSRAVAPAATGGPVTILGFGTNGRMTAAARARRAASAFLSAVKVMRASLVSSSSRACVRVRVRDLGLRSRVRFQFSVGVGSRVRLRVMVRVSVSIRVRVGATSPA